MLAVSIMMPKDAYAASNPSCDDGIPTENYVESIGKWRLLPPLTRASYDVSVEVFGIYQECWYDYYLQIDEGNPIVIRVQNDVSGSLLDEPVSYTFAYRHQIYDLGGSMSWTPYTYVQYQGSYNLAKFNPVIPQSVLDDFDTYIQSELYVGCKDANNHVVRKYFNFICLNKGTETDYNSAILGLGSDLDKLESTTKEGLDGIATGLGDVIDEFQTSEVSVEINEPSYIVEFRDYAFGEDTEPSYIMPDPCPDVFLLEDVYNAFMPSEIAIFSGSALLLLLCGWWLRQ